MRDLPPIGSRVRTTAGVRYGSLFSGAGGLDLAVEQWTGATAAWVCQYEPPATPGGPVSRQWAAEVLAARWGVPNLGDITAVDWSQVEPVDVICGGFPCQGVSNAGKRLGLADARSGLWSFYADAVRHLRPRLVLIENVGALLVRGLDTVLCDLAEVGYDATWGCVRASDAGAPHRRERVFIVATDAEGVGLERVGGARDGWAGPPYRGGAADGAVKLLPTPTANEPGGTAEQYHARLKDHDGREASFLPLSMVVKLLPTPSAADAIGSRREREMGGVRPSGAKRSISLMTAITHADWGDYAPAIERWEHVLGRPAPEPVDGKGRLSPRFVEWMMGWPDGWVTHLDHLGVKRTAQLRLLGNGVVPQQALLAFGALETLAAAS